MRPLRASGRSLRFVLLAAALASLAACSTPETITLQLETLNDSGVTGTVTFTEVDRNRTRVDLQVEPAGHPVMPAHVHPGSCEELVPQPRYGLLNVENGASSTTIQASLSELFGGGFAVNLHASAEQMEVYTACADLIRPSP